MTQSAAAQLCPRCEHVELSSLSIDSVELRQCPTCSGIWLDSETFSRVCNDRAAQQAAVGIQSSTPARDEQRVQYLKCPRCAQRMSRQNFGHSSGVVVDRCFSHGVWCDRDEIRRIVDFIRAGGLLNSRQPDVLELERARLRQTNAVASKSVLVDAQEQADHLAGFIGLLGELLMSFL